MNAAKDNTDGSATDFTAAPPQPENTPTPPETEPHYNTMANIIAQHENAVNRLKRGK